MTERRGERVTYFVSKSNSCNPARTKLLAWDRNLRLCESTPATPDGVRRRTLGIWDAGLATVCAVINGTHHLGNTVVRPPPVYSILGI